MERELRREEREEKRVLPSADQERAVGVQVACAASWAQHCTRGQWVLEQEVQDPRQSHGVDGRDGLGWGSRAVCRQPRQGHRAEVAGLWSGTQGGRASTRASRSQ